MASTLLFSCALFSLFLCCHGEQCLTTYYEWGYAQYEYVYCDACCGYWPDQYCCYNPIGAIIGGVIVGLIIIAAIVAILVRKKYRSNVVVVPTVSAHTTTATHTVYA